jgi:hypothetical protein
MRKVYVIAGSNREFESWCQDNRVHPSSPLVRYIPEFEGNKILRGQKNPEIISFGTYNKRRDRDELENLIRALSRPEVKIVYVEAPKEEVHFEPLGGYTRKVQWKVPV